MKLRIGVNALYLIPGGVGGTEIYLRNLLQALASADHRNTYFVFTNRETDSALVPPATNFVRLDQPVRAVNRPLRLIWEQSVIPVLARRYRLDCMFNPGFTAPALISCPNVTVFHDLQHKRHPEYFRWFDRPAWQFFLWLSVKRTRVFIADSDATRNDLIRYYHVNPDRIRVAWLGVEDEFFSIADRRTTPKPYILCASTLHPHKNIERLVRVFAEFQKEGPHFQLVLAGLKGFRTSAIEMLISRLSLRDAVRVTGWLPRTDLFRLFRYASAFVYPSTFEGFGLPVVEAMAAGVPLACSDIEPLRSITAGTAILFNPDSDEAMLEALRRVTTDCSRVAAARERARDFTWAHCAEVTLGAIRDAVSGAGLRAESSLPSSNPGT